MARVHQLPVIAREVFEARIRRFNEDVRLVTRRAQHVLDAEHLLPDGVTVPERGEHLVDGRARHASTAPAGTPAATSAAGGSVRRRRAKNPGSGSIGGRGVSRSRSSRSSMYRYFRSITGQS